jgi:hypothetical protein
LPAGVPSVVPAGTVTGRRALFLPRNGITFKNYNFRCPSSYSILALFKKWATAIRPGGC